MADTMSMPTPPERRYRVGAAGDRDVIVTTAFLALDVEHIELADQVAKMMAPSRGMLVLHDSRVTVARQHVISGIDSLAAFAGTSLARPSPYVTQSLQ